MQITDENGTRELEVWEVEALEAAQKQHDDSIGYVRQYSQAKADAIFNGILANLADIPEYDAVRMVNKFQAWEKDTDYKAGWKLRFGDGLFTVLQDHTSQAGWEPPNAPSLYAQVLPGQQGSAEGGEPGEWVQPDSTNPYMAGDRVTHGGFVWTSEVDNNVWEPGTTGAPWTQGEAV